MTLDLTLGLATAVVLFAYLLVALLRPELF
ncbi:K(+)-transporting ATPase subunit F [Ancylobacter polymorphus]|uniref:K(+)-transporting ATPase subunit F n=1 Tax=Ancylobacter polymorphus TaxID=223390 RepID=A0A9E6ZZX0_9HYPH|nr:K(+)-transporting ATPase subunit F [Ancylobacter polymorphus]MDQ0301088.1 K+-transporting ATPase KdpF subunit [Ancylobacter polymorphus]UOK70420.1 K(+)-transporting ATPase subunit F [Ancylobacter polymorphus]